MTYIIIEPQGVLSSKSRAEVISCELFNLTQPVSVRDDKSPKQLFQIIKHKDSEEYALEVDVDLQITVHPQATLERLVSAFPEVSESERMALQQFIYTSEHVSVSQIIPSSASVRSEGELQELGWFEEVI